MKPNKRVLHVQKDLFWEDEHATPNHVAAAKWFDVIVRSDEEVCNPSAKMHFTGPMRGSMTMAKKVGRKFDYANALKWLSKFRSVAINHAAMFMDMAYALRLLQVDEKNQLFLRPVSPFKEFAGGVFDERKLTNELNFLEQNKNIPAGELLCVVAPPEIILEEWRCVFVNGQYASGSRYMVDGELSVRPEVPQLVVEFAQKIANDPYWTNIFDFVLDIGMIHEGTLGLVEVNSFETASFYGADLDKIYEAWYKSFNEAAY